MLKSGKLLRVGLLLVVLALLLSVYPTAFAQGPEPEPEPQPVGGADQGTGLQVPESALEGIRANKSERGIYIVLMEADPVIAYEGGVAGLAATKAGSGQKANPNAQHVRNYVSYLVGAHDAALRSVGADPSAKLYDLRYSVNGFVAKLSPVQAAALANQSGVISVMPDTMRYIQTDNTPDFLGLTDRGGPWARGIVGEDVVVGVIDTGIWPEHPSFEDDGSYGPPPATFFGTGCDFGNTGFNPADAAFTCNNKLLAAKSYGLGFHGGTGAGLDPGEYNSARDADGHGSHTTSTAAGNADVPVTLLGIDRGTVSGMAPRARVSAYKACWSTSPVSGGCSVSDLAAAIDEAVADGVDVINYSIGSTAATIGPDDIAFLFAADGGVHVATSAGNSGPDPSTVGSPATVPWLTSVGASTQSREFIGEVELGDNGNGDDAAPDGTTANGDNDNDAALDDTTTNGNNNNDDAEFEGITVTGGTASGLDLVDAADHGNELCDVGTAFSPSVAGKIVLCRRGIFARVSKSLAVFNDGGAGMILYNAGPNDSLNTDNHYLPSLHVTYEDGLAIKAYIAANPGTATATIEGGKFTRTRGNVMASFSSRGPDRLSEDIIKPDVTAPGVNVLAGNTPTALLGAPGELFQAISGTSMSSPHVAGVFALLKQAHPDWSPAMAKSALMTTARHNVDKEDGVTPADPFDFGAGHIQPGGKWRKGSLAEPGLVYDAGLFEYAAFTCGADLGVFTSGSCDFLEGLGIPSDPSDLNLASIGVAELVGSQTVIRTVTSVASNTKTFRVSVDEPPGYSVKVSPKKLTLGPGDTATYEVTITNDGSAGVGDWAFGSLAWRKGNYSVYSPIAARAFPFAAPAEVSDTGTAGSASVDVQFGYNGPYTAAPHGLVPADLQPDTVADDPANNINVALGTCDFGAPFPWPCTGITWHAVTAAAGDAYVRISLFDAFTDGADDLDLYVFNSGLGFIGGSGSGTSAEQVDVPFPGDTLYYVAVHGWQTDGPDSSYTLFDWAFGPPVSNLTVDSAPASASVGATGSVDISWSGLSAGTKYLGAVSHSDAIDILALTLIDIDTN
jgi:subtilisin family serine protease